MEEELLMWGSPLLEDEFLNLARLIAALVSSQYLHIQVVQFVSTNYFLSNDLYQWKALPLGSPKLLSRIFFLFFKVIQNFIARIWIEPGQNNLLAITTKDSLTCDLLFRSR